MFLWWHFKPTKMIAGDDHLRRHQDRKIGNFLLQLLVPSDLNGSSRKTCKDDDDDDDDLGLVQKPEEIHGHAVLHIRQPGRLRRKRPLALPWRVFKMLSIVALQTYQNDSW